MNIWFAGISPAPEQTEHKLDDKRRLFSYFDCAPGGRMVNLIKERLVKGKLEIFLDSGAFSAWSKGVEINIDEYIQFIKDNEEFIEVYANLDVIGDAEATYKNQKYMESKGLKPLPCYHIGEPIEYLFRYLQEGYDYIALGGMVSKTTQSQLVHWLDTLFSKHLTDAKGYPTVKIHGFGITSLKLLLRYPWYSVDSTSWVKTGRFGAVFIPVRNKTGGGYDYSKVPHKVMISDKSPKQTEDWQHYSTVPKMVRDFFDAYLTSKGYTPEELAEDYKKRDEINIMYFLDLEKYLGDRPFPKHVSKSRFF